MIFEFHSCEGGRGIKRRHFTYLRSHGELELYCLPSNEKLDHPPCYVKVSDTRVVVGRFSTSALLASPCRVPTNLADYKLLVRADLFTFIADKKALPSDAVEFGFSSDEVASSLEAYETRRKEQVAAQLEKDRLVNEKHEKESAERLAKLQQRVAADEEVEGTQLVDVARSLGIDIHPRTVGCLYKRIRSIKTNSARVAGKGNVPPTVYHLYDECRKQLLAELAPTS